VTATAPESETQKLAEELEGMSDAELALLRDGIKEVKR
jgi:hypothetical protein